MPKALYQVPIHDHVPRLLETIGYPNRPNLGDKDGFSLCWGRFQEELSQRPLFDGQVVAALRRQGAIVLKLGTIEEQVTPTPEQRRVGRWAEFSEHGRWYALGLPVKRQRLETWLVACHSWPWDLASGCFSSISNLAHGRQTKRRFAQQDALQQNVEMRCLPTVKQARGGGERSIKMATALLFGFGFTDLVQDVPFIAKGGKTRSK